MGKESPKTSKQLPTSALAAAQQSRGYVHFDTSLTKSACAKLVTSPHAVSRHSFYPFIRVDFIRTKFKRLGPGKIERSRKLRDIRYAAHADAAIYAYYNFVLMQHYEQQLKVLGLSENVTAFRALGKSNIEFAQDAFDWIDSHRPCVALGFDVKDFFGSLHHATLKKSWAALVGVDPLSEDHFAVFRSLTKHASVELVPALKALSLTRSGLKRLHRLCDSTQFRKAIRGNNLIQVNPNDHGIPQGSPISASLSNIYMLPFDAKLKEYAESRGGLYRRYCDDILIVVPETDAKPISDFVESALTELKLTMQTAKTLECHFGMGKADKPLQYLGLVYDGAQVTLRASGVSRFYVKMRRGVRQYRSAKRTDGGNPLLVQRRKELLNRYSAHTSKEDRTYFNYVKRAARKTKSAAIQRQLRRHRNRLTSLMEP